MATRDIQPGRRVPHWRVLGLALCTTLIVVLSGTQPGTEGAHRIAVAQLPASPSPLARRPTPTTPTPTASIGSADVPARYGNNPRSSTAVPTATSTAEALVSPTGTSIAASPTMTTTATGTDGDGTTADATQQLSPEQQAQAQAALINAQYRMSRARTFFRIQAIAAAEAQLRDAQANLQRVITASNQAATATAAQAARQRTATPTPSPTPPAPGVTPADIAAAQTALQQAQAQLQATKAGPDPAHIRALQATLAVAQQDRATVDQTASAAKTAAEQHMLSAADSVRSAQTAYTKAFWQNQQAQLGIDPLTSQHFQSAGPATDSNKQHYTAVLATADAQVKTAQAQLDHARAATDTAKQQEITDVAAAQARVDQAQHQLDATGQPPSPAAIAAAQTQVDQSQAHLTQLQTALAAANAAQAQAQAQKQLADAQAKLAKTQKASVPPEVAAAQTQVTAAQTQLNLARQSAVGSGGWMWPTFGTITSGFGLRDMVVGHFHNGIDIANAQGTPIGAARNGVVIEAGWCSGYGYCVKLNHAGGFETEYGHLAGPPPVHVGQSVSVGTIIGAMGTSYDEAGGGFSTGVHLHFTIRFYGVAVDPLRYLP